MENGKVEPTASELVFLSGVVDKPITYFFPKEIVRHLIFKEQEDELMNELVVVCSKLSENELQKIIDQIRAIVDYEE